MTSWTSRRVLAISGNTQTGDHILIDRCLHPHSQLVNIINPFIADWECPCHQWKHSNWKSHYDLQVCLFPPTQLASLVNIINPFTTVCPKGQLEVVKREGKSTRSWTSRSVLAISGNTQTGDDSDHIMIAGVSVSTQRVNQHVAGQAGVSLP